MLYISDFPYIASSILISPLSTYSVCHTYTNEVQFIWSVCHRKQLFCTNALLECGQISYFCTNRIIQLKTKLREHNTYPTIGNNIWIYASFPPEKTGYTYFCYQRQRTYKNVVYTAYEFLINFIKNYFSAPHCLDFGVKNVHKFISKMFFTLYHIKCILLFIQQQQQKKMDN